MQKVLFINHSRFLHGAETVMCQVIDSVFSSCKENVFVCQPSKYESVNEFQEKLLENGYTQLITLPYQNIGYGLPYSIRKIINNLYALIKLCFFVRKNGIGIVFSNTSINFLGIMTAIFTGRKHIWHFHESLPNEMWNTTLKILYRILLRYKKNTSIFISEAQKKEWQSHLNFNFNNSIVIYNQIKPIVIADSQENDNVLTFGYIGSWSTRKNIPFLIETFAELNKKHSKIKLVLNKYSGEQDEAIQTVARCIEKHKDSNIISDVKYNDSSYFFSNIDVLVITSFWESMSLVALEAMSVEKCVIMTDNNSGLHELFDDNVHCFFVDPENKESLYDAMEKLLLNEKLRLSMAKNSYEKIKSYDFNRKFADNFNALFS